MCAMPLEPFWYERNKQAKEKYQDLDLQYILGAWNDLSGFTRQRIMFVVYISMVRRWLEDHLKGWLK
jgi:hypothetical protein